MNYEEVLLKAREVLAPKCRVCKDCNGIACRGEIPGAGGYGKSLSFIDARKYFERIRIHMDAVHEHFEPDTSITFFGEKLSLPVMAAPIGGLSFNYTGYLSEGEYSRLITKGARMAGTLAFTGDGPMEEYFDETLPVIEAAEGKVISTVKPWEHDKLIKRIETLKPYHCPAVAMDIDSAALINLKRKGKPAFTKSVEELRELVSCAGIPFLVKGVMTPESALRCAEAGISSIVVSTHGGRIFEDTMPPIEMLPEIKAAVGDRMKILVDGAVRSGGDVFKCLAMGADAVLIGRPYAIAVHGGGAEGAALYTEKIREELRTVMLMTDCRTVKDITREKISIKNW